jgi:hypothetical protein
MKTLIFSIIAVCALLCSACVPSLHPLYTEADLTFDPALVGIWIEPEGKETWDFTIADVNEYRLVHTDDKGKKGEFEVRLVMFDGRTFLDLSPVGPTITQNDFYAGHIMPVHSFVQLHRTGTEYKISFLDPNWLKSQLGKNPGALRHAIVDEEILITDTPKNLQKFLTLSLNSPGAFSEPVIVRRRGAKP